MWNMQNTYNHKPNYINLVYGYKICVDIYKVSYLYFIYYVPCVFYSMCNNNSQKSLSFLKNYW